MPRSDAFVEKPLQGPLCVQRLDTLHVKEKVRECVKENRCGARAGDTYFCRKIEKMKTFLGLASGFLQRSTVQWLTGVEAGANHFNMVYFSDKKAVVVRETEMTEKVLVLVLVLLAKIVCPRAFATVLRKKKKGLFLASCIV